MEIEARVVPRKVTISDDTPGLRFEISDDILVIDFEHDVRHDLTPVFHELQIGTAIAPEFREIMGELVAAREQSAKAGDRRVTNVATHVDDAGVRQRDVNEFRAMQNFPASCR